MSAPRHRLLLASAGTGKTFRLTHHLIDLLLQGVDPGRILASTFTRKAAGEILDRVLARLVEGSTDPKKLADLNRHLAQGQVGAEECLQLLAGLVLQLDRFQVRTLDAFFVHVGHLFAFDLGLPAGWTIADTHQWNSLVDEAIGRLIEELPPEELLELLRGITKEEAAQRSVGSAMRMVINAARDAFLESEPGAWERVDVPDGLPDVTFSTLVNFIEDLELPLTAKGEPKVHWKKNHARLLECLRDRDWRGFLKITLVGKALGGDLDFDRKPIEDDLRDALTLFAKQARHELMGELAGRNRATVELLTRFQGALDAVKRERGQLTFSDLPLALAPAGGIGAAALDRRDLDLDFRLDARIDHLLLDEFQDTAPVQWRILERTAEEILGEQAGERTFFCVGDVKQSIYGWRSAEPRLLSGLGQWYQGQVEVESLADNYRSSKVVLDTVNRVFRDLVSSSIFSGDDKLPLRAAAQAWQQDYPEHVAKLDLPGDVLLYQARAHLETEHKGDPVLDLVAARVAALAAEAPSATIGVLLRSNGPIPKLLERLLMAGLRASGEGGNPLTDSRAVLHLLSALHLADHPGDTAAAFHLEQSPLWPALQALCSKPPESPAKMARFLRARLLWQSLGDLCTHLAAAVDSAPEYGDWDRRRFGQLVDLAYARGASAGLRLSKFVEVVRETKVEDPSASAIKVMTVHASKGLEFDAVLLPELDEGLSPTRISVLSRRPDPRRRYDMCSQSPTAEVVALDPELQALYDDQKQRVMEEALCVLYVAMTRARHRLEMFVRERPAKTTYAKLLRDQLGAGEPDEEGVIWRHPDGQETWFVPDESAPAAGAASAAAPLVLAPSEGPRERPSRTPSGEEGGGDLHGSALLRNPGGAGAAHGTLIHSWMEQVEWLDDFDRGDEDLLELALGVEPDLELRRAALTSLRDYLAKPAVQAALNRADGASAQQVWRERSFSVILPDGDGGEFLCSGSFDRVVLELEGEQVLGAELLDYKTDAVTGADLAARVEKYRPQLESYRRALAAMTGLAPDAISACLLFLHAGERVQV